jgi:hypothetical protein
LTLQSESVTHLHPILVVVANGAGSVSSMPTTVQPLTDADVHAILKLLSETPHVTEFRLRYGDVVIELRNAQQQDSVQDRASATGAVFVSTVVPNVE